LWKECDILIRKYKPPRQNINRDEATTLKMLKKNEEIRVNK